MIEIGLVGAKNSGKTTLIEALVRCFVEFGLKVATVKHTGHDHSFDTAGKDSHRHRQAGAAMTLAVSGKEMALFGESCDETVKTVLNMMSPQFDLCLVEGDKQSDRPKILLTHNVKNLKHQLPDNVIATYGSDSHELAAPSFPLDDVSGLVGFLMKRFFAKNEEVASGTH